MENQTYSFSSPVQGDGDNTLREGGIGLGGVWSTGS